MYVTQGEQIYGVYVVLARWLRVLASLAGQRTTNHQFVFPPPAHQCIQL